MTTQTRHPLRVRLYGGRATHAARDLLGGAHETACEYYLADGAENHWLAPTADVSCGRCLRVLRRADGTDGGA